MNTGRAPQGARGLKSQPSCVVPLTLESRPARGAWVEISSAHASAQAHARRAPQGARGLKFSFYCGSHLMTGRAPQGARGLKLFRCCYDETTVARRAPQGARGLKSLLLLCCPRSVSSSRPARGAWVEIKALTCFTDLGMGRAPQGARGLKSSLHLRPIRQRQSRPARGAWVEIQCSAG